MKGRWSSAGGLPGDTQRSDGTADEYAELGNFGAPEMMFGNSSHNRYGNNSYGNKRKNHASAAPMEKLGSNEQNQTKGMIRKTGIFLYENGAVGTIQHVDVAKYQSQA